MRSAATCPAISASPLRCTPTSRIRSTSCPSRATPSTIRGRQAARPAAAARAATSGRGLMTCPDDCYVNVHNDAMAVDTLAACGVYFGTTGGQVYASADAGDTWTLSSRSAGCVVGGRTLHGRVTIPVHLANAGRSRQGGQPPGRRAGDAARHSGPPLEAAYPTLRYGPRPRFGAAPALVPLLCLRARPVARVAGRTLPGAVATGAGKSRF